MHPSHKLLALLTREYGLYIYHSKPFLKFFRNGKSNNESEKQLTLYHQSSIDRDDYGNVVGDISIDGELYACYTYHSTNDGKGIYKPKLQIFNLVKTELIKELYINSKKEFYNDNHLYTYLQFVNFNTNIAIFEGYDGMLSIYNMTGQLIKFESVQKIHGGALKYKGHRIYDYHAVCEEDYIWIFYEKSKIMDLTTKLNQFTNSAQIVAQKIINKNLVKVLNIKKEIFSCS